MTLQETIAAYCKLQEFVSTEVFQHAYAADCFCGENESASDPSWHWRNEDKACEFIRDAVYAAVEKLTKCPHCHRAILEDKS